MRGVLRLLRARSAPTAAAIASLGVLAGCGAARQDAHEPSGTYHLEVVRASFPPRQVIARNSILALTILNRGSTTAPNVAVTIDSFNYVEHYPELASNKRPIWVIEHGPGPRLVHPPVPTQEISQPGGAQTAYVNTWALGPLEPGRTRTFIWRVVPVKGGTYTVHYRVAAGLAGKAQAQLPSGAPVNGEFTASIAGTPPRTHVDPTTGRVVVGPLPLIP